MKSTTKNAIALLAAETDFNGFSKDPQAIIREFAHGHGYVIVSFLMVEEDAVSTGLNHALSLCAHHQARVIIIDEPATLALPKKELLTFLLSMAEHGLSLIFASSGATIGSEVLYLMYQLFYGSTLCDHKLHSHNIKKSLKSLKQKGVKLGGKPFGAATHESKIIQQILKLHNEGASLQKICDLLRINNIQTVLNKKWHPTTIKRIIERNKLKYGA